MIGVNYELAILRLRFRRGRGDHGDPRHVSWLAYFRAFQLGPASRVAPIDKLSLPLTVLLAVMLLHEPMNWRLGLGVSLMVVGALLTIR